MNYLREDAVFRWGMLWIVFAVLVCPVSARSEPPRRARLVLQWYAQAQFAGYFVAQEKGFYTKRGVDLRIVPGGADVLPSDYIDSGKAEFGTMFLSAAIEKRGAGVKLVNIGQIVQQSALMLVARKSSGITGLPDLEGARIGMWGRQFQVQPRALFKRLGIKVDVVQQSPSFDLFMRGGLDAVSAMWYNEYHTLMSYGLDPDEMVTFFFSELDLDFPEDGIYCLEKTWQNDPAMCRAVLEGSLEGWRYAFAHPDEALEIVLKRMRKQKVRANRSHQRWMLARMKDIILDGAPQPIGVLRRGDFERTKATLLSNGFIWAAPEYKQFYKGPTQ